MSRLRSRGARLVAAVAGATLACAATAPIASAELGDNFGVTSAVGQAWPGPDAFWAGACDLSAASTSGGGVGTPPASFAHCIAQGKPYVPTFGDPNPIPPRETTWQPGMEPSWRLDPATQAGGHPDMSVSFWMRRSPDQRPNSGIPFSADGDAKTVMTHLPPGIAGDPRAVPQCPSAALRTVPPTCPPETQIGVSTVSIGVGGPTGVLQYVFPVWNVEPRDGKTAELMISAGDVAGRANIPIEAKVRTDGDFGIDGFAINLPGGVPLFGQTITLWGVPWAASHDKFRPVTQYQGHLDGGIGRAGMPESGLAGGMQDIGSTGGVQSQEPQHYNSAWGPIRPFTTSPTECSPTKPVTGLELESWQNPGILKPYTAVADAAIDGCADVPFDPSISLQPTTHAADSPAGIDASLEIPQNREPPTAVAHDPSDVTGAPHHWKTVDGLATSEMKDTVVTLPTGVTVNPSAANGQQACSPAQIGLVSSSPLRFDDEPVACPNASKVGTAVGETPLLDPADYPRGEVYVATQNANPFNSLLALYMVLRSPKRDLTVKLAGKVDLDPVTGRITTAFRNNPQLPVSRFDLHFKSGPLAPLATPVTCGSPLIRSELTPYSAPGDPAVIEQPFAITSGPGATACPASASARPFGLGFSAGATNPVAGAHSPFTVRLTRPDGAQELDRIELKTPKGLSAKLAGIPYCSEGAIAAAAAKAGRAELASPTCPASQIGTTTVGAGAGSRPFYTRGRIYLAGPYKGQPLSLAIIVPAVAGPFDLGTVVVRTAMHVNPRNAEITAISDPLPRILEGIPLRVRDARVDIDRPGFTLNPTDCSPTRIDATVFGVSGARANLTEPFEVDGCSRLKFDPKLTLALRGRRQTKTGGHPAVHAVVTQASSGQAGIERAMVKLPRSLALDPDNAQALCEYEDGIRDDLDKRCPKGSVVGRAKAVSPLLDKPLAGNVFFVKNIRVDPRTGNKIRTLPMIVVALRGQIPINLYGESSTTASGRLVNTFSDVPDAPVSRFTLNIEGGSRGILTVTRTARSKIDLCRGRQVGSLTMNAQNGRVKRQSVKIKTPCPKRHARRAHARRVAPR